MEVIKVGIIDDDGSKVTQIMAYLLYGMKDASKQKADRYSNVRFEVLEIPLSADMNDIAEYIIDEKIDAVKMELPEYITDHDSFFEDLGFPKEAVRNRDVRIIKSNSRHITISYGDKSKEIEKGRLEKYKVTIQTKCVVLKIKALWNSSENNLYGIDKKKAIKCIPDIENYEYVPVNNSMLAKAEIPFLIFERNRGKCFVEMY